jgi:UDP-N-acetylmuramoylalanine--D-glutamate ligase
MTALVHGLAVTGASTVRALQRHGHDVVVSDDRIDEAKRELAGSLGLELVALPGEDRLAAFVDQFEFVSPAPGVPESHPLVIAALATGVPLVSEIELAYRWEQERPGGPRPMLAITGTDGKTTTTELTVAILTAAGVATAALGNTDVPLVDAIDDTPGAGPLDAFVVECTSFRLAWTQHFRAEAAAWLNLAPDHLNWHASMATYEAAKARIWAHQHDGDVAIGYADDPVVMARLAAAPARHRTFGRTGAAHQAGHHADYHADYHAANGWLVGPEGPIAEIASMRRSLPHDVTNALAASALVLESL